MAASARSSYHPVKQAIADGIAQIKQVVARLQDLDAGIPEDVVKAANTTEGHLFIDELIAKVDAAQTLPQARDIVQTELGKLHGWVSQSAHGPVVTEPLPDAEPEKPTGGPPPENPNPSAYPKIYEKAGSPDVEVWNANHEKSVKDIGYTEKAKA
jgi:hypothetical protein